MYMTKKSVKDACMLRRCRVKNRAPEAEIHFEAALFVILSNDVGAFGEDEEE